MATFEVTRSYGTHLENTKLDFQRLFLRRISYGLNSNQLRVVYGDANTHLGDTDVNNWAIYDGLGENVVARAKGIHVNADDWYISFVMVFEIERFRGSTLEIMGTGVEGNGAWAIVGGTGDFEMARGVINRNVLHFEVAREAADEQLYQLTIEAFCRRQLPVTRVNPSWGGHEGSVRDLNLAETPERLESVTIRTGGVIDTFKFSYIDLGGRKRIVGPWGAGGPADAVTTTIVLGPSEVVTAISGTMGKIEHTNDAVTVITSLVIVTDIQTYGPFGDPIYYGRNNNTGFSFAAPENRNIVSFYGRSDRYLNAIGVYIM